MEVIKRVSIIILIFLMQIILITHQSDECGTLTIRAFKEFKELENCTAILGNLRVSLISDRSFSPSDINSISFPKLGEVTGYLLLANINHLKSLSNLFPNLSVIRGRSLFSNYALILYGLKNLREIDLYNLVEISRGGARAELCSDLCYFETVNWKSIITKGTFLSYPNLAKILECPTADEVCYNCLTRYCWTSSRCQAFSSGTNCHYSCLGHCHGNSSNSCYSCQKYKEDDECVSECSKGKLLNTETLRCIDPEECKRLNRKKFGNKCEKQCPPNYSTYSDMDDIKDVESTEENFVCKKCTRRCPKICDVPGLITRVQQIQNLDGCTVIRNSLEISMVDDLQYIDEELMKHLGNIEEVWGHIKIYRSTPITSLEFLNNLSYVQGSNKSFYAIYVFENYNLQTIMDWNVRNGLELRVGEGYIQFRNNEMLCPSEIAELHSLSNQTVLSKDLDENTNGYKKFCVNENIKTNVTNISENSATIIWTGFEDLKNISYKIFYINTTLTKISAREHHHIERDTCSAFSWNYIYLSRSEYQIVDGLFYYNLTDLHPFTRYFYFIQTYEDDKDYDISNSTEFMKDIFGQSEVEFFRTKFVEPSRVVNVATSLRTDTSITLSWDVVGEEHEIITHFLIDVTALPEKVEDLDRRNYCEFPIENFEMVQNDYSDAEEETLSMFQCCKNCEDQKKLKEVPDYLESNKFDDDILMFRGKRDINFMDFGRIVHHEIFENHPEKEVFRKHRREVDRMIPDSPNFIGRKTIQKELRNFTIEQLKPFNNYEFKIYACGEDDNKINICSTYELYYNRTLMNPDYDKVQIEPGYSADYSSFKFTFLEPKKQNSVITSYNIQYNYFNGHETMLFVRCITRKHHERNKYTYILQQLHPGFYTLKVQAVSIAGKGNFSDSIQFSIKEILSDMGIFNTTAIAVSVVFLVIVMSVAGFVAFYYRYNIRFYLARRRGEDGAALMLDEEPMANGDGNDIEMVPLPSANRGGFRSVELEPIQEIPEENDLDRIRLFEPQDEEPPVRFFRPMSDDLDDFHGFGDQLKDEPANNARNFISLINNSNSSDSSDLEANELNVIHRVEVRVHAPPRELDILEEVNDDEDFNPRL